MKIVINTCWGGFSLSDYACLKLGIDDPYAYSFNRDMRLDPKLVELVEKDSSIVSGNCAKLAVVDIPDEVTDWIINEYDGKEDILYVIDGKLNLIDCDYI